uniref:DDHD domain-containing protein n=1 Tax=Odontella aurita TaxID=265563 RepID=A0A7S4MCP5_9STRA|mmetsp:Transcript_17712/g.51561  ORF Transcript_17712/g.51561 Transcript_17712/m.51561 type:complete len:668 (+) Transcript_17712:159-2162(+)|eukprot:CAMPEP_0113575690 /NCGR_PEP_ID=MMETSP0015_2-20120614/27839_1 /TAXON_ID=2838 /ORGANISM="Odontella" /LENGTH=667 /DNA_ID=CAMNT_0000478959 /DNA_START=37 /DNA_END=2040 /DNA_ORIENTATION=+ /assembly_acc=CAM_ASM_000160
MPNWDGIEDASSTPSRVWLSREKDVDPWRPLRKADCRAINSSEGDTVHIECGRATADLPSRTLIYNFFNAPSRRLVAAIWFWKEEKSSKEFILHPLSETDDHLVERFYQKILEASSSLGNGLDAVLKEEVSLEDDKDFKVTIIKSGGILSLKKRPKKGFALGLGNQFSLQRGFGAYTVEGEDDELALGPVENVIFVVHGVGEAMWSREGSNVPSLMTEVNQTRARICEKLVGSWKKNCERAKAKKKDLPPPPGRIEILPIEWYDRIHSSSSSLKKSLISTTLLSVPKLRAIANDVVFDVLMYLTPEFCEEVLDCVTMQVNDMFIRFQTVHSDFVSRKGKCALVGHSLGSVIAWDLLSNLQQNRKNIRENESDQRSKTNPSAWSFADFLCGNDTTASDSKDRVVGYQAYVKEDSELNEAEAGTWGPVLPKRMTKVIPFVPEFTIFLGSPLGMFLTLRGARPVFNEIRKRSNLKKKKKEVEERRKSEGGVGVSPDFFDMVHKADEEATSPFCLPTGALYNIFHPSDPVAYRIEPLLLAPETPDRNLPPPEFLTVGKEGVRLHVKARELGGSLFKGMSGLLNSIDKAVVAASEIVGGGVEDVAPSKGKKSLSEKAACGELKFALGGSSRRVDYQLQPGVVDNEYLSAITAHSSYFANEDLLDFVIEQCHK